MEEVVDDDVGLVNTIARTQRVTEGLIYNPYNLASHVMSEVGTPHCLSYR